LDYLGESLTLHNYKNSKKCVPREAVRTESTCIDFIGEAGEDKGIKYFSIESDFGLRSKQIDYIHY
jgi:hypothetical protein